MPLVLEAANLAGASGICWAAERGSHVSSAPDAAVMGSFLLRVSRNTDRWAVVPSVPPIR